MNQILRINMCSQNRHLQKRVYLILSIGLCLFGAPEVLAAEKMPAPTTNTAGQATKPTLKQTVKQTIETEVERLKSAYPRAAATRSPQQTAQISEWANGAVEKIQAAQTSINKNQLPQAKQQLSEAQTMLDRIQQSEPTDKAIEKAEATRKQVEQGQITKGTELAPLEQEVISVDTVTPVPQAKEHLKLARQSLEQKSKAEASQHLVDLESQLIYAEANLPVSRTKQDVLGAQTLLEQGKSKEAKKLLTDSLRHIQVLAVETDKTQRIQMPETVPAP